MADNDISKEIYEKLTSGNKDAADAQKSELEYLRSIDKSLEKLLKEMSQSSGRDAKSDFKRTTAQDIKSKKLGSFGDEFEKALYDSLGVSDFKKSMQNVMKNFAEDIGVELDEIPGKLGQELGQTITGKFSSKFNKQLENWSKDLFSKFKTGALEKYAEKTNRPTSEVYATLTKNNSSVQDAAASAIGDLIGDKVSSKLEGVGAAQAARGTAMAGAEATIAGGIKALTSKAGIAGIAATLGVELVSDVLGKELEKITKSFDEFKDSLASGATRNQQDAMKRIEEGNKRIQADIQTIVEEPFKVLKDAAQAVYDSWDGVLRLVNQTQGYTKADLQSLYSDYASRLKEEGLERVVSSADIITNLQTVLESGLSGYSAQEFAYEATKLNALIPTQDFFTYAETYSSIAANAIKNGVSQEEAVAQANAQLEQFASNLLYASRELSGGFTTGLQDASSLFQQSVEIANAARTGNANNISAVLTSVSAITGAIAPDLASSIVESVYNAAVGGNSSQLVALRSLAGINASNTEFLKAFAEDPQSVFSKLFNNLANLQNMSPNNYMEVAEGLSNIFGLSSDAFARVDFNYLADAIDQMVVSTKSLDENMDLLQSGESTLSAEQMKMAQINEYMLDEGLAYVLDNEAARSVQEHLWDEQLALEMQQATYGVELRGKALEFFQTIANAVTNLLNVISLGTIGGGISSLQKTITEALEADDRVKEVLQAGAIGSGNKQVLQQLTTYGKEQKLTNSYLSMLQQSKSGSGANSYTWGVVGKSLNYSLGSSPTGVSVGSGLTSQATTSNINTAKLQSNFDRMLADMDNFYSTSIQDSVNEAIEKETARLVSNISISQSSIDKLVKEYMANPGEYGMSEDVAYARAKMELQKQAEAEAKVQAEATVNKQFAQGKFGYAGYDAWAASASKYGISDLSAAMETLGYSESDVRSYFTDLETQKGTQDAANRSKKEEEYWKHSQEMLDTLNMNVHDVFDKTDMMGIFWPGVDNHFLQVHDELNMLHTDMTDFTTKWVDYYINHTTYNDHLGDSLVNKLNKIYSDEKKTNEDKINALTEAFLNTGVEDLLDPTVQGNLLLSQILSGIQVLIQQNNTQGKLKLPDAIAALATGSTFTND